MTSVLTPHSLTTEHSTSISPIDMSRVGAVIMGGGQGSRLAPLTNVRCKPAVSFGGRYRLIDIAMSNAINSGCKKIYILTQFLSASLHKHIFNTYRMGSFASTAIEVLSAEQKPMQKAWFQGTADAVRKNIEYLKETPVDYFLILSGDQLYNFNFQKMMQYALETDADLVVAALPVSEPDAKRMGLLKFNEDRFVTEFQEKPTDRLILDRMRLSDFVLDKISKKEGQEKRAYLGSMGIYLFKRQALFNLLKQDEREDFGKHLIPTKVGQGSVSAYIYEGYWEDIGTIDSFFKANMALTGPNPAFSCYEEHFPIYSEPHNLPAPKITDTHVRNAIICEGSFVSADEINNTILGPRSIVKQGTIIRNSYVMGNDFYTTPVHSQHLPQDLSIGEHCLIDHALIDKNVHIGNGVQLINKDKRVRYDSEHVFIRDGIIVVASGARLPDGFVL